MRPRRTHTGTRQRGAVMVETVLFLPVVVLLVFGVVEFSFAYQASSVLADATRAAAREGGAVGGDDGTDADGKDYVGHINDAASIVLKKLPRGAKPEYMMIYKANEAGFPGPDSNTSLDAASLFICGFNGWNAQGCRTLAWNPTTEKFDPQGGSWPAAAHNRCTQPYDRIGVAIFLSYEPLTNIFGPVLRFEKPGTVPDLGSGMTDHAVFAFEPAPLGEC